MWTRFQTWRSRLPYSDALDRRNAELLQTMGLSIVAAALLMLGLPWALGRSLAVGLAINGVLGIAALSTLGAVALVRRGLLQRGALVMAGVLVAMLSIFLYGNSLRNSGVILFSYALPIVIGGMLAGRRGVIGACLAAIFGVSVVALLETMGAPGVGMIARTEQALLSSLVSFTLIAALLGSFIDALRVQAVEVFGARRTRERELELLSRRLEQSVRERTADLEIALAALEQRAAESERLLAENQGQREAIRALSVPVLPLDGRTLVMPLVGELDGPRLEAVQAQALAAVEQQAARRLLLDITGVPLIDTYVAQSLLRTLTAARLLGAEVILVGVRPEVAQAMVGLGIDLGGLRTFADLQSALR